MSTPLRLGLVGIGGYAQQHLSVIRTLQGNGQCRLMAVADPFADRQAETVLALQSEGVAIYADLPRILERDDIDAVFIATPIHLHAPQAIAALEAGKHVYLEKPPCPTLGQWQQIVAAQEAAAKVCVVGFQMQTSAALRYLKRQLVQGTLGRLETVSASIRWCRMDPYYDRAPWAGRWAVDGQPVFDGPATNALAHVVHGAMFLAGATEDGWAALARVRGNLKKARPVESYDTCYLEAETTGGVNVRLAFTHASASTDAAELRCAGSGGTGGVNWSGHVTMAPREQEARTLAFDSLTSVAAVLDFFEAVRRPEHRPFTRVQDTLAYLQMVNGAAQSSGGSAAFDGVELVAADTPQAHYQVAGLDAEFEAFRADPDAVPPLLQASALPWLQPSELAAGLAYGA
ncbi:MAG TPA: Gfo/Idh/MocA family oxidoreductase [Abditibacteriaceae bacterium]|nr:Gfo/Idh/MocA family oxidoreductase [Abditibacteriaceae bacterium]